MNFTVEGECAAVGVGGIVLEHTTAEERYRMRYRQVHLDFHTSEMVDGIGGRFDAAHFQRMLRLGSVNSINLFAKCHQANVKGTD